MAARRRHAALRAGAAAAERAYPVLFSIATFASLCGVIFVFAPEVIHDSAIGEALPVPLERAWGVAFFAGGALTIAGLSRPHAGLQLAGLAMLGACSLTYALALVVLREWTSVGIIAPLSLGVGIGCLRRAWVIDRASRDGDPA
jgi:hypothetical protein